jgi:hypothetical protein
MDMSSKDVIPKDDREKEKQTILEMLLPEKPKKLVEKTTPIKDRFQAAIAIGRLDRFLRAKVITEEEMAREKSIILKQAEEAVSASERAAKISLGLKSNDKDDPVKENSKSYWIDLGSSQNKKSIEEKWVSLKLQFVELFNGLDHKVTKTTQRRVGLSYHLKVGPFKDLIKPKLMCDQLTKQNIVCSIDKKMS